MDIKRINWNQKRANGLFVSCFLGSVVGAPDVLGFVSHETTTGVTRAGGLGETFTFY